jgi:hypothetical protein
LDDDICLFQSIIVHILEKTHLGNQIMAGLRQIHAKKTFLVQFAVCSGKFGMHLTNFGTQIRTFECVRLKAD